MNLLSSFRRKRRIESEVDREGFEMVMDSVGDFQSPDAQAQLSETQTCVRQAIAMLDEERRVVLILRDFEDMDYDSISKILDIPIGTVRSRLHRARLELKMLFQSKATQLGIAEES
jgi:RNA polymerase sigma-70 factor, ECF subfamily